MLIPWKLPVVLCLLTVITGCSGQPARELNSQAGANSAATPAIEKANRTASTIGYVADAECASCHAELYASYQSVGMAKSFYPATPDNLIEDFENAHYYHAPSDQHYEMLVKDDGIYQRRYQLDEESQRINELEIKADFIVGSGNHIRSYLYQTPAGEMFQMPLAWYSKTGQWRMNPGYDRPQHAGYQRKITRECMFCHNAYPLGIEAGVDEFWQPHVFGTQLPHGIGCQRCHGPGGEHVQLAASGTADAALVRDSVVNPSKLSPELRDDVCNQCHLQPSSQMLSELVRGDRPEYSYRPGQPLHDYRAMLDYQDDSQSEERFEINHHAYRLRQSQCFSGSAGALSCTSCHDPHKSVPESERLRHYRQTCLQCHTVAECSPALAFESEPSATDRPQEHLADCAACHMPQRRTHDVIHATMTDHNIVTRPEAEAQRLAERDEPPAVSPTVQPAPYFASDRLPERAGSIEVYQWIAGASAGNIEQLNRLIQYLNNQSTPELMPLAEAANALRELGAFEPELQTLGKIVQLYPNHVQANLELAMAMAAAGQLQPALVYYRRAEAIGPALPETHLGIGMCYLNLGDLASATKEFREAVRLRPLYPEALLNLGIVLHAKQEWREAREYLLRAKAADPSFVEADYYLQSMPPSSK